MASMQIGSFTVEQLLSDRSWAERLAGRLANCRADAEDLVQEGWIAAIRARPDARDGLRPWLTQVFRHAAASWRRSEGRRRAREEVVAEAARHIEVPSPEELVAGMEVQKQLAELVLALEPAQRDVVLLRYYQGLTGAEIARALGAPEGTVRWRLKAGLDELRRRLDERYAGERAEWLRAITLLLARPRSASRIGAAGGDAARTAASKVREVSRSARVATAVLVIGGAAVLIGLALRLRNVPDKSEAASDRVEGPARASEESGARRGSSQGGTPLTLAAVAAPADFDDCKMRLAAVRASIAATEPEYVGTAAAETLFRTGAPNPAATAALAPVLARIMKGDAGAAPDYTFECRTWACRLKVLQPEGQRERPWMQPLQRDRDMMDRTRGMGFGSGPPVKDPVSSATFREVPVHIRLADPSGAALRSAGSIVNGRWRPAVPASSAPIPTTLGLCRTELAAAERRLSEMKAVIEKDMPLRTRWERERPNPTLTKDIDAVVRKNLELSATDSAVSVECHGQICRVVPDRQAFPDSNVFHRKLEGGAFRGRSHRATVGALEDYYWITPADTARGNEFAKRLMDELLASSTLSVCESQHAPSGRLEVELCVPATGEPNDDGEIGKACFRLGGALSGTPFARCVQGVLEKIVTTTSLPTKVTSGGHMQRIDFPRPRSSAPMSSPASGPSR